MSTPLIKIAAVLALLAVLFFGEQYIEGRGYARAQAEATAAINAQKAAAAQTLANEADKTRKVEQRAQAITNAQNLKDADHAQTIAVLSDRLRTLAGDDGRLRDPNAAECGGGSNSPAPQAASAADSGADNPAQTGGLLSVQLSDLLQARLREADAINIAYASCRADAVAIRGAPP